MHNAVKSFFKEVKKEFPHKFRNRRILEVGAHSINGSIRKYFWFCRWTGVDITPGKNVDVVGEFNQIPFDRTFQVVVSCEMLEHDKHWQESLIKMYKLLEPGGLIIITCAAPDRIEHGTARTTPYASPDTTDYYRNISTEDFRGVLHESMFQEYVLMYRRGKNDLQFYGTKHYEYSLQEIKRFEGY